MFNGPGFIYDSGRPPLDRRRCDRRGDSPDRRSDEPTRTRPGRPTARRIAFATRLEPRLRPDFQSDIVVVDVATGRRTRITNGPRAGLLRAGLAARRQDDRRPWRSPAAERLPQRHLAVLGRRQGRRRRTAAATSPDRHDIMPGSAMNSDITPGEGSRLVSSADGAWLSFLAPKDGAYQLWRIATVRRRAGAADRRPALPVVLRPGRAAGGTPEDRVDPLRADGAGRPLGPRRPPRRARGRSPRSTRRPWLTSSWPSRRSAMSRSTGATSRAGSCRARPPTGSRKRAPLPLVTQIHGGPHTLYGWTPVPGVPDPRRERHRRVLLEPARLGGLRPGVQRGEPARLGPGPVARRPRRDRRARRRRPRRPRSARADGRLVRRLPHELDHRPRPAVRGRDDVPLRQRHVDAVPDRRHQRRRLGGARVRDDAVGRPRVLPVDLAAHLRRRDPDAAADPAQREATSGRRSARPRRCSPCSARRSVRSG